MKKQFFFMLFILFTRFGFSQCNNVLWTDSIIRQVGCNCIVILNYHHFINPITDSASNIYTAGCRTRGFVSSQYSPDEVFFVRKYDSIGNLKWSFEPYSEIWSHLNYYYKLSQDSSGNIYLSIPKNFGSYFRLNSWYDTVSYLPGQRGTLIKIDTSGHALWAKGTYGKMGVTNKTGESYFVGDRDSIEKRDSSGNLIWIKNISTVNESTSHIRMDHQGNVIVTFSRYIEKLDSAGNVLWLKKIPSQFNFISYGNGIDKVLSVNSNDEIFVSTYGGILKVSPSGMMSLFSPPYMGSPNALFVNSSDEVVVQNGYSVYYFDPSGNLENVYYTPLSSINHEQFILAGNGRNGYFGSNDTTITYLGGPNYFSRSWGALTDRNLTYSNAIVATNNNKVCIGDTVTLQSIEPGTHTYQWYKNGVLMPGETGQQLQFDSLGSNNFFCILDNDTLCPSNTINITIQSPLQIPTINQGTIHCGYTQLTTSPNTSNAWHNWYRNDSLIATTSSYYYNASVDGMYTITDSNACGVYPSPDTIYVQIHPMPSSGIQPHRYDFCDGGQVTLTATSGYTYYQWYYGGNSVYSNTITFTSTAANVNLTLKDSMNCTTIEHFQIFEHSVTPAIQTSAQTYCSGDSVTLNVTPGFSAYMWSTGDTTGSITVLNGQFFSVMVSDSIGCQGSDSITIDEIIIPQPNLYFDTLNCVLYTDSLPNTTYQWYYNGNPAGNDSSFISADSVGSYFLVIQQNGCNSTSDTLYVNCLSTFNADLNSNLPSTDFILFPDPASSVLTILNYQNLKIEITDLHGRVVFHSQNLIELTSKRYITEVNISQFTSGPYFVRIGNRVKKFIKN